MEKAAGKIGQLIGLRAGLVVLFFGLAVVGILATMASPFRTAFELGASLSAVLLLYSLALGDDAYFMWAWIVQAVLWAGAYPLVAPAAGIFGVIAFAAAVVALLDAVHTLGLVFPMSMWKSPLSAEESEQAWRILSRHFSRSAGLAVATFLVSAAMLASILPVSLALGPIASTSIFAAVAVLVISLAVAKRPE